MFILWMIGNYGKVLSIGIYEIRRFFSFFNEIKFLRLIREGEYLRCGWSDGVL